MKLFNNYVLLEPLAAKSISVVIPVEMQESNRARVLSVGQECKTGVKVGDTVLYSSYGVTNSLLAELEKQILVRETDIYGVLD